MKIKKDSYVDVPKGTKLTLPNPDWDGDDPKTHYNNIEVITQEKICVLLCEPIFVNDFTKIPEKGKS